MVVVVGMCFVLWKEVIEDRLIPKRWGVVEHDTFYRSGQLHYSLVREVLEDEKIDVIVNLTRENASDPDKRAESAAAAELGIDMHRFPLKGNGTGDPEMYVKALIEVDGALEREQRVLVHCAAGSQRTGVLVAYYRLLLQERPGEAVLQEMASFGLDPTGDAALIKFANDNVGHVANRLVEEGVLKSLPAEMPFIPGT
jgi:protein tyrosine/serine phosphatase